MGAAFGRKAETSVIVPHVTRRKKAPQLALRGCESTFSEGGGDKSCFGSKHGENDSLKIGAVQYSLR
jgi:hypothetical protein